MSDDHFAGKTWCPHTDSNRGPTDYKSVALPAMTSAIRSTTTDKQFRDTDQQSCVTNFEKTQIETDVNRCSTCVVYGHHPFSKGCSQRQWPLRGRLQFLQTVDLHQLVGRLRGHF